MYYAYIHEIRLSSAAVCVSEGYCKQDAPTLGKSLDSLSRLHQDTGRRCWTVRKQPKSRVQISLLFFFLLCSPSFLLNFSPFFLGADLPFQLCLILEDRTTYHSMSTTPFRQNEKKYSSKSIHFSRVVYLAPTDSTCPSTGLLKTINLSHFSSTSMDGLNTQVSLN